MIDQCKENDKQKNLIYLYLILETVFFVLIKWAENFQTFSLYGKLEYAALVLNFLVMLFYFRINKEDYRIPLALTITLIADYFLTLTGSHFFLGVFFFVLVQIVYGWKLTYEKWNLLCRFLLFMVFFTAMKMLGTSCLFATLCGLSISCLFGNVLVAMKRYQQRADLVHGLLALGLILFLGCDLNLGISLTIEGMKEMTFFYGLCRQMVWIFYLPSQVCLTLSYVSESISSFSDND